MKKFEEQKFTIPKLKGISERNIEEHLKLYAGYVKHANLIVEKIAELKKDTERNAYALGEVNRRFGFEFNGMRNHEVYFHSFEGGSQPLTKDGPMYKMIVEHWGSFAAWLAEFTAIALTRGIGWACLYYDPVSKELLDAWVDEQHMGQLANSTLILGLDMWEHAFVADYQPSGKKNYIEDFFSNVNWRIIEENYSCAAR